MKILQFIVALLPTELKPFAVAFILGSIAASMGLILDPVFIITVAGLWLLSPWIKRVLYKQIQKEVE